MTITTIIEKPIMMSIAIVRPSVNRLNGEPKPGVPRRRRRRRYDQRQESEFVGEQQPRSETPHAGRATGQASCVRSRRNSFVSSRRAYLTGVAGRNGRCGAAPDRLDLQLK